MLCSIFTQDENSTPITESPPKTILIIGAGLAGLSAALKAQSLGHQVILLEKEDQVGGKVTSRNISIPENSCGESMISSQRKISYNPGATIVTMPEVIYAPLQALGIDNDAIHSALGLIPLSPAYHLITPDTAFDIYSDPTAMFTEISRVFDINAAQEYLHLRKWLQQVFQQVYPHFIQHGFSHARFRAGTQKWGRAFWKVLFYCHIHNWQQKLRQFIENPILQRAFSFQALFAGLIPKTAYSMYMIIAYMDTMLGVYYPVSGISIIAETYARYVEQAGGTIHLNHPVTAIKYIQNTWKIYSQDKEFHADAVIMTCGDNDFSSLLDSSHNRRFFLPKPKYSPSAVVAHFLIQDKNLATQLPHHHTISSGMAWETIFDDILSSTQQGVMRDPALLITRIAAQVPSPWAYDSESPPTFTAGLFPETQDYVREQREQAEEITPEIISVLIPCANLHTVQQDWDEIFPKYILEIQDLLIARGFDIFRHATLLHYDHPGTWLAQGNAAGTPFSRAHILRQTGPFRAAMRVSRYPGLYRAGADTVPGIGIPSVIISGLLAAEAVHDYFQ